ncbi:Na+-driven multidrug efflux pump [Pseudomonas asturiensis]|uniref:Na+-driven multidrug efflux pump n=1 Tax=Pseudomonas asturiensis TaxID=1190415 RepID=A0A1M7JX33_9PSED|nr:MATE family efflux transporter [Pseudomonas asturiensis]SHM57481.1 Na+-driven multidrug efflux pump [Pseudomonas asturiensis]
MTSLFETVNPSYATGSIKKHIVTAVAGTGASFLAIFLLDILSVVYISLLHDEQALAAFGVVKPFTFLISTLLSAFNVACGALLSRFIEYERRHAAAGFIRCLFLVALSSIGIVVLLELAGFSMIAQWLGLQGEIKTIAHDYIFIVAPAMIVMAAAHLSIQVMRTYGMVKVSMWMTLGSTGLFAVIAPLCMFVLDLGLTGTAIAYAVTAVVTGAICFSRLIAQPGMPGITVAAPMILSIRSYAPMLLRLTFPAWLANLATFVSLAYLLATLVPYGASALAAMTIIDRFIQTVYCFFFAIPYALTPIIGQNMGAGNAVRVRDAIDYARRLVLIYGALVWLASLGLGSTVARVAGLSAEGSSMLVHVFIFAGPLWILIGRELVAVAVFVSFKTAWYVPAFAWLRATIGTVPFVWLGSSLYGSSGAFIAMLMGNAGVAIIASIISQRVSLKWQAKMLNIKK